MSAHRLKVGEAVRFQMRPGRPWLPATVYEIDDRGLAWLAVEGRGCYPVPVEYKTSSGHRVRRTRGGSR